MNARVKLMLRVRARSAKDTNQPFGGGAGKVSLRPQGLLSAFTPNVQLYQWFLRRRKRLSSRSHASSNPAALRITAVTKPNSRRLK